MTIFLVMQEMISFVTSAGDDIIDGGADSDTVDYSTATGPLNVTLVSGAATITIDGTDTLTNIENLTGTSANDSITGDSNNNTLIGNAGNDTLRGNAGNDNLQGGTGDDRIFGGVGTNVIDGGSGNETTGDWVDYSDLTSTNVTIDLTAGTATATGISDTISNIENVKMGDGNDSVQGNIYNNSLIGGSGNDTLDVSQASSSSVAISLTDNNGTTTGGNIGTDTFESFENFIGSSNADTLTTAAIDNITFNGAGNTDKIDYTTLSTAVTVTINGTAIQ
jgi:Ca2+-binding RTX toxin-like protein